MVETYLGPVHYLTDRAARHSRQIRRQFGTSITVESGS
jgi:hypothetical protein